MRTMTGLQEKNLRRKLRAGARHDHSVSTQGRKAGSGKPRPFDPSRKQLRKYSLHSARRASHEMKRLGIDTRTNEPRRKSVSLPREADKCDADGDRRGLLASRYDILRNLPELIF